MYSDTYNDCFTVFYSWSQLKTHLHSQMFWEVFNSIWNGFGTKPNSLASPIHVTLFKMVRTDTGMYTRYPFFSVDAN